MTIDKRKVCFVIMGFGKKTDYESGRTLDLDATYETIIYPAATNQGMRCIRADEIMHSGSIDREMYEMLLRAELVVADISTGNVNAVYELGVRHALCPQSTIIMKESEGKLYFDLSHVNTFQYEHLGKDIGSREAERARRELENLIINVMSNRKPDSPVYTYLPTLQQPRLSDEEYRSLLDDAEAMQEQLISYMHAGESSQRESRHLDAIVAYTAAAKIKPEEPYILQRLALATYKGAQPSPLDALLNALRIIEALNPDHSNDPETLGIAGAIRKRIWSLTQDNVQLDAAIKYYGRGFEVRRDYYNGENLAKCYDFRAEVQNNLAESQFDRMSAKKVRLAIIEILSDLENAPSFSERSDRRWVFATHANCLYALGDKDNGIKYEKAFYAEHPADWEIASYIEGKRLL